MSAWHVAVADRKWGARVRWRADCARALIHERRALEQWNARCARRRRAVRWEAVSERAARRLLRRAAIREWASNAKRVAQVDRKELDGAVRHARDRAIARFYGSWRAKAEAIAAGPLAAGVAADVPRRIMLFSRWWRRTAAADAHRAALADAARHARIVALDTAWLRLTARRRREERAAAHMLSVATRRWAAAAEEAATRAAVAELHDRWADWVRRRWLRRWAVRADYGVAMSRRARLLVAAADRFHSLAAVRRGIVGWWRYLAAVGHLRDALLRHPRLGGFIQAGAFRAEAQAVADDRRRGPMTEFAPTMPTAALVPTEDGAPPPPPSQRAAARVGFDACRRCLLLRGGVRRWRRLGRRRARIGRGGPPALDGRRARRRRRPAPAAARVTLAVAPQVHGGVLARAC